MSRLLPRRHHRSTVPHGLGRAAALERLHASAAWARGFSDLRGTWSGDTFSFAVTIQGVALEGTLRVEEERLVIESRLPLVALPFVGWIPRFARTALEERAPSPPPAGAPEAAGPGSPDASPVVLFLHIPKAAGTTLGEYVFEHCRVPGGTGDGPFRAGVLFLPYGFFKDPGLLVPESIRPALRRPDLRAVKGHFWYGLHEHLARPARYVTMLRDPVERVLSLHHHLGLAGRVSLEAFVADPPFREVDNDQTRRIAGVDPPVGGCTEEHLRTAEARLRGEFAAVGVSERFEESLALFRSRLGWAGAVRVPPRKVSARRPTAADLPAAVVEAIRERNALDARLHRCAAELLDSAAGCRGGRR